MSGGEITGISPTKHGSIAVEVEGEFLLAVSPDAWEESGLSVGDVLGEETLAALQQASGRDAARKKALSLLSQRDYTRAQLQRRLAQRHGEKAAGEAVTRMEEIGLVNDAAYAERFAEELMETRGYAPRRIRYELQKRGIAREDIEAALLPLCDRDETAAAVHLLERKYHLLTTEAEVRRAAALLERCGYSGEVIRTAVHAVRRLGNEEP